jgi:hypothetical protein
MHGFLELFVNAKPPHTTIPLILSKLPEEVLSKSSFPGSTITMVLPWHRNLQSRSSYIMSETAALSVSLFQKFYWHLP